jgi:hypothetical protein
MAPGPGGWNPATGRAPERRLARPGPADLPDRFNRTNVTVCANTHTDSPTPQPSPTADTKTPWPGDHQRPTSPVPPRVVLTCLSSDPQPAAGSSYRIAISMVRCDSPAVAFHFPDGRHASWPSGHPGPPGTAPNPSASLADTPRL